MKGRRPRGNEDARIFFLKSKTELVRGFLYLCSLLFFAPESTKSLSLSLSFPSLRVFLRPSVCACVSVEARAVVGKRNIIEESFIFFFFFFRGAKALFAFLVSLSKQSRGRKGTEQRDLAKNNGLKDTNRQIELTQLNFHNNKQQEEKKYTKQTTFLLDALFFQRLENVLFHLVVSL